MNDQYVDSVTCSRCGNVTQQHGLFCLRCGAPFSSEGSPTMPRSGGGATPMGGAGYGRQPESYSTSAPGWQQVAPSNTAEAAPTPNPQRTYQYGLTQAFGYLVPASLGRRLGAFSIDVAVCVAVAAAVYFGTTSAILAGLAGGELMIGLMCWEARRGTTLGQRAFGVWTTTSDEPQTPGIVKSLIRGSVTVAGGLGAVVGAWVVAGSSAWDPARSGQGWQDRVAGTRMVFEPHRREARRRAAMSVAQGPAPMVTAAHAPAHTYHPPHVVRSNPINDMPPVESPLEQSTVLEAGPMSEPISAWPSASIAEPMTPRPESIPRPLAPAPVEEPPAHVPAQQVPVATMPPNAEWGVPGNIPLARQELVLTFDTGQQLRVGSGQDGVIGRAPTIPAGMSPAAQPIAVHDPDTSISKNHLSFVVQGSSMWICDLRSTNGSAILGPEGSGRLLAAGQQERVTVGDRVQLGRRVLTIE